MKGKDGKREKKNDIINTCTRALKSVEKSLENEDGRCQNRKHNSFNTVTVLLIKLFLLLSTRTFP